jgi:hypothetical protein
MGDFALTNMREARAARSSLNGFLDATKPVTKPPNGMFRSEAKAEARVWGRQFARNEGAGHLDNAIRHLDNGTAGSWTASTIATLRQDRAVIGDGIAPTLVGDIRAHVGDAVSQLDSAIQAKQPGPLRLAGFGLAIAGVAALGVLIAANHD